MAAKSKRIIYSDADCHRLVDIIISYRNVIECKKTDATTWKQKNATWEKIAEMYNSGTTERRTSEQLRCKYDNLKKEVRKYEAQKRQNLYKTGGLNEPDIKGFLKLLYDKIKSIITFSVNGLEPSEGDSDVIVEMVDFGKNPDAEACAGIDLTSDDFPHSILHEIKTSEEVLASGTSQPLKETSHEVNKDWFDYTPKMLKSKKHKVLQVKRKKGDTEIHEDDDSENLKLKMFHLKKRLLEKEDAREEAYHEMKMKKEEELYNLKIKNQLLQNEKLELEIRTANLQFKLPLNS